MIADTPTLGLLIGMPLGLLVALIATVLAVVALFKWRASEGRYGTPWGGIAFWSAMTALVALGITAVAMWPWERDYHFWVEKEGIVQETNKRIVSSGENKISQRYVVTIDGQPYGVDDTRAALLKRGDFVKLACKREFEWGVPQEANGWACRWNGGAQ